ncbi:hypothetical protein BJX76DRAFT_346816 [Aspergillus varians]
MSSHSCLHSHPSSILRPLRPVPSAVAPPVGNICIGPPPPCERCHRHKTVCILDEDADRRRKGALERRLDSLEQDRTLLLNPVDGIRDESQDEASKILNSICNDAPWIDRDLFLRDMQSSNAGSQFCSQFLVNAILAVACHYEQLLIYLFPCYCDSPETRRAFDISLPGRLKFYNEARRLLDQEEGKLSLTGFQSRCDLYLSTWIMGKHMLGRQYSVEIVDCAQELTTQRDAIMPRAGEQAQELARTLDTAITGSFSAPFVAFSSLHQSFIVSKPTIYSFQPRGHDPEDTWCPYTAGHGTVIVPAPAHSIYVGTELFNLQLIFDFPSSPEQWALELPESLTHAALSNNAPNPAILDLHLRYHSAVINILECIKPMKQYAEETIVSRWSMLYMPFAYIRYANVALSILLADLDNEESKECFINSYASLHILSCRFPIAKEGWQLILEQARQLQTNLPREITCLHPHFESELD